MLAASAVILGVEKLVPTDCDILPSLKNDLTPVVTIFPSESAPSWILPYGLLFIKLLQFPTDLHIKTLYSSCIASNAIAKSENLISTTGRVMLIDKFHIFTSLWYSRIASLIFFINSSSSNPSFDISGNTAASNSLI